MQNMTAQLERSKKGFTLVEILFALLLSGLLLASGFFLLDGLIRSLDARTISVWDRIESARLESFFLSHLEEPSQQGKLSWVQVGNDPESTALDWIFSIARPETMLARSQNGRSVLAETMEIGWDSSSGFMIREKGPDGIPSEPAPFRPLLEENPFTEVVFYRLSERGDFIEMSRSEIMDESGPPLPHILHIKVSEENDTQEGIWVFLDMDPT